MVNLDNLLNLLTLCLDNLMLCPVEKFDVNFSHEIQTVASDYDTDAEKNVLVNKPRESGIKWGNRHRLHNDNELHSEMLNDHSNHNI